METKYKGSSFPIDIDITDNAGAAIDLTGKGVLVSIKHNDKTRVLARYSNVNLTDHEDLVIMDAEEGQVRCIVNVQKTRVALAGEYDVFVKVGFTDEDYEDSKLHPEVRIARLFELLESPQSSFEPIEEVGS